MILDSITDVIRATSDAAATTTEPDYFTSWVDVNDDDSAPVFTPGQEDGQLNGLTPVDIITSPGANEQRQAKYISVFNRDTVQRIITFEFYDGTNARTLAIATLQPDQRVAWEPGGTWYIYDANGLIIGAASPPTAHATTHEDAGSDEIDVTGLSGLLADDQNPVNHATDHENAGGDEISVAGLSGLLADDQNPVNHASDHENAGGDEIDVGGLSGLLADAQTPLVHRASHISGGGDAFLTTDFLDAIIARIRTTTGPTDLLVGAVADGEFLQRSGAAIIGTAGGAGFANDSFEAYDSTGGQAYAGFPGTVVDLDTVRVNTAPGVFSWTPGTDVLQLLAIGFYLLLGWVSGELTAGTRGTGAGYFQEDASGSSSFGSLAGTDGFSYHRATTPEGTASFGCVLQTFNLLHQVRMVAEDMAGSAKATLPNGSRFIALRLT